MSKIEWTDRTWNPVRGCSRVSPGCENCYAEKIAERFSDDGRPFHGFATLGGGWTRKVELLPEKLTEPLKWRKPARVFVNSMSDLFHEELSNEDIAAVFGAMALSSKHTFQALTKRPKRMREWFEWISLPERWNYSVDPVDPAVLCIRHLINRQPRAVSAKEEPLVRWPLANVWLGVSVEDQQRADERIPLLLDTPAAVRFVSAEPLLAQVSLRRWLGVCDCLVQEQEGAGMHAANCPAAGRALDWVIIGGESGRDARKMDLTWARKLVTQCRESEVACFVKQLGSAPIGAEGAERFLVALFQPYKGNDPEKWPEDLRVREFPPDLHRMRTFIDAQVRRAVEAGQRPLRVCTRIVRTYVVRTAVVL